MTLKTKKGFGILEVMISGAIITMMLGALVSVGRIALNNNENLEDRTQASYYAREGIELVRQMRDSNWVDKDIIATTEWNSWQWNGNSWTLPTVDCSTIYYPEFNSNRMRWGLSTSAEAHQILGTIYRQEIKLCPTNGMLPSNLDTTSNLSIIVESTVRWDSAGMSKSVTSRELLTDWRPNF